MRPWSCLPVLAVLAGCASFPSPAFPRAIRAVHDATSADARHSLFYARGDLGLGLPDGLLGAGIGVHPASFLSAELGAGLGDSGPQASLMANLHYPIAPDDPAVGVASGVSLGPQTDIEPDSFDNFFGETSEGFKKRWDVVVWSNTEVQAWTAPSRQKARFRMHFGLAVPIAHSAPVCGIYSGYDLDESACAESRLELVPYFGFGLMFDL